MGAFGGGEHIVTVERTRGNRGSIADRGPENVPRIQIAKVTHVQWKLYLDIL